MGVMQTTALASLSAAVAHALATAVLVLAADGAPAAGPTPAETAGVEFFEKRVRPVLAEHCYSCHGPKKQRAGLALDTLASILKGGDRGPAVVPGKPDSSLLIQAVCYSGDLRMPPKGKLKEAQIADLVAWVKMGAPGPKEGEGAGRPAGDFDLAQRRKHWAYQPVRPVTPPGVKNA